MHDWSLTVRVITLGTTWTRNTKYFNSFIGIIGIGMWPCMCGLTQSHAILCDPMDCSLPSSSVCGIFQARILEWVAISSSTRSSQPRDWTHVSCILAGRFFTTEPLGKCLCDLSSVQSLSHVWLFVTLWTAARQYSLSITNSWSLLNPLQYYCLGNPMDRGPDHWMISLTQWTGVWASSGRWWRTGKPGVLQSTGSQRVRHDWVTELELEGENFFFQEVFF